MIRLALCAVVVVAVSLAAICAAVVVLSLMMGPTADKWGHPQTLPPVT